MKDIYPYRYVAFVWYNFLRQRLLVFVMHFRFCCRGNVTKDRQTRDIVMTLHPDNQLK